MKRNRRYAFGAAEFKKLQAEWYRRLRLLGFNDVEKDEQNVRQYSSNAYRQASHTERVARLAYYRAMEHALYGFKFTSYKQKYVLLRTADGAKGIEIIRELSLQGIAINKHTVTHIIRRFEHEMGIREWSMKQRLQK